MIISKSDSAFNNILEVIEKWINFEEFGFGIWRLDSAFNDILKVFEKWINCNESCFDIWRSDSAFNDILYYSQKLLKSGLILNCGLTFKGRTPPSRTRSSNSSATRSASSSWNGVRAASTTSPSCRLGPALCIRSVSCYC